MADVLPIDVLRKIAREPLPSSDQNQRQAQRARIQALIRGQPAHVARAARALLKVRWNRLAARPRSPA